MFVTSSHRTLLTNWVGPVENNGFLGTPCVEKLSLRGIGKVGGSILRPSRKWLLGNGNGVAGTGRCYGEALLRRQRSSKTGESTTQMINLEHAR